MTGRTLLTQLRASFAAWLAFYRGRMDPESLAYCQSWMAKRDGSLAGVAAVILVVFHAASLAVDPLISTKEITVQVLRAGHLATLGLVCGFTLLRRRRHLRLRTLILPAQAVSIASYLYLVYYFVSRHPEIDVDVLRIWTTFIGLALFQILTLPTHSVFVPLAAAALYLGGAVGAWAPSPYMMRAVPIATWIFALAALLHICLVVRSVEDARREFEARRALATAERARLERELELAREIQGALAPPAELKRGSVIAYCFQRKHSRVGGDWAAMRDGGRGDLYVVVADAAGKGVQAALVIHAVQSLWAETLGRPAFEPRAWLERVNHALCQLSEKQPHMVTIGILHVDGDRCVYWSAGHLPLFVISGDAGAERVKVVTGRGTPLGTLRQLTIEPSEVVIDAAATLLLGSDGVFDRGTLYRSRDIVKIRDELRLRGNAFLDDCLADDDKTLIWVDKVAAVVAA